MLYTKIVFLPVVCSTHWLDVSCRFAHDRLMPQTPQAQESADRLFNSLAPRLVPSVIVHPADSPAAIGEIPRSGATRVAS